jgi:hypothetical protein
MRGGSSATRRVVTLTSNRRVMLLSPRPWDFPPSIDGDVSREDSPMELDEPEGVVSLD